MHPLIVVASLHVEAPVEATPHYDVHVPLFKKYPLAQVVQVEAEAQVKQFAVHTEAPQVPLVNQYPSEQVVHVVFEAQTLQLAVQTFG
jgi:hypothetical protein